jgi:hypothetical protein
MQPSHAVVATSVNRRARVSEFGNRRFLLISSEVFGDE